MALLRRPEGVALSREECIHMALESVSSLPSRSWSLRRRALTPYLFILPFGLLFLLFFIVPILYAVYESLFRSQRSGLVQVPVMLGLALILALLLDSTVVRFKAFFRLAFFVPYAIPGIIAALLWGYLYDPALSPIVKGISGLGLGSPDFLGARAVLWSIANIATWAWTGYNMLIIFAALQAIPTDIYESARIDGSSGFHIAWHLKIPLVAPALVLTGIFSIIGTLQLFNEPQVLTAISNNIPTSFTPNLYAYYTAFGNNNYYYAATIAVVLALVTCVLSFGFLRVTQRQSGV